MSQKYYIDQWRVVQSDINNIIAIEKPLKPGAKIFTREDAIKKIFIRYAQYIDIYKRLLSCYDNLLHAQKRILLAKCIEGVAGRIVELRYELLRIRVIEYVPFGALCEDFSLQPEDLDVELSRTFLLEKVERLKSVQMLLSTLLGPEDTRPSNANMLLAPEVDSDYISRPGSPQVNKLRPKASPTSAAVRKGTLKGASAASLSRGRPNKLKSPGSGSSLTSGSEIGQTLRDFPPVPSYRARQLENRANLKAVVKFQAAWRGYKGRVESDRYIAEHDAFLGMTAPPALSKDLEEAEKHVVFRRILEATKNHEIYMREVVLQTQAMKDGPYGKSIAEDMMLTIKQWILDCREITGKFPDYPPDDIGGSAVLFTDKTPEQIKEELDEEDENKGKKAPKPKPPKKKEEKAKKKQKSEGPESYVMPPSAFLDEVVIEAAREYEDIWRARDETKNAQQRFDRVLLKELVKNNVEELLRKQIDLIMRDELERIALAVDKQKMPELKPTKPKKEKQKKGKKKTKDLTQNVPMDELFKEMVTSGIIKRGHKLPLKSYIGTQNLLPDDAFPGGQACADLADVRKMVFDFVILPMSSSGIHEHAPFDKTLLLAGAHGSGKSRLVHSICYELGATMIDLSPDNIAGKYPGKEGQRMLTHLVMKLGKAMEPTVIFVDKCDLMFTRKPPPEAPPNSGRLKGDLMKIKKMIGPEDRIMIIGTTSKPFRASQGPLFKLFDRVIYVQVPSHASRYQLWETSIKKLKGVVEPRHLQLTTLATLSKTYTASTILMVATEVLTGNRILRQNRYPLTTKEFIDRLGVYIPIFREEQETLDDWYKESPSYKKNEMMKEKEEAGDDVIAILNAEIEE